MPSNLTLFQKLKEAELKTAELYRVMAEKADSLSTKEKLRKLAEDELLHAKMVENSELLWLKAYIPGEELGKILKNLDVFLQKLERQVQEVEKREYLSNNECKEIAQNIEIRMGEIHINSIKTLRHTDLKNLVEKLSSFDHKHLKRIKEF